MNWLLEKSELSVRKACDLVGLSRSGWYRAPTLDPDRDRDVQDGLNKVVDQYNRWGFWKCFYWLRQQGNEWNHKRVLRVYREMGLNLQRRTKKRVPKRKRQPLEVPEQANVMWSMDFMQDTLMCGKRFRVLNIMDEGVREILHVEVDTSLPAARVVRALEQIKAERPLPKQIRVDNGPELIAQKLLDWCEANDVHLHHIQPGKPAQNAYIERFNRTFRTEVLDAHIFNRLSEVKEIVHDWMTIYNQERPHSALGNLPPSYYAHQQMSSPDRQAGENNQSLSPAKRKASLKPQSRYPSGINGPLPAKAGPLHLFRWNLDCSHKQQNYIFKWSH